MDAATHIAQLRTEADALLDAYRSDPTAPVATCPGWDRAALLAHVAGVHAWVRAQLALGTGERVRLRSVEQPPEGDALPSWYEAGVTALVAALEAMDTDATWPTWAGPQPGTFFPRRMAQETAMHRWDAAPNPVDTALAIDGTDEHLELFAPLIAADKLGDTTGTVHLHATDLDGLGSGPGTEGAADVPLGEWLVHLGSEGIRFERGHAKGDVAVRGSASDLLLWTWNRVPVDDRFQVFGDPALLDLWRSAVTI